MRCGDTYCVINVPGAAELTGGDEPAAEITTVGVLIVLLSMASWTTVFLRARAPLVVVWGAGGLLMLVGVSYALALVGVYHALIRWPRRTVLIGTLAGAAVALFVLREVLTAWGGALAWTFENAAYDDAQSSGNIGAGVLALLSLSLARRSLSPTGVPGSMRPSAEFAPSAHTSAQTPSASK